MRIHTYGEKGAPVVIMLLGSFCNADIMANIIRKLEKATMKNSYHLKEDYSEQEFQFLEGWD